MIICTGLAIILAMLFLSILICDKTCRSVPMMLVANSFLAGLVFGCTALSMAVFTLENDLQQIYFYDSFCSFRGYMIYMSIGVQRYSYLLQAIYRYTTIVYPSRLFLQSARFQGFLICLTWICGIIYPIPILLTKQITYQVDDQICQMPLQLSFLIIFHACYVYLIPVGAIMCIYFKMVRYVQEMSKRVMPANTLSRAQRELRMVHRIVLLVSILLALGIPYTVFILMSFFNSAPKYHFRIAYLFADISLALIMIVLCQITDPLKISVMKRINGRRNMIVPQCNK